MRVLFISSGNTRDGINIIVRNQGESLRQLGVDVDYYTIRGRGIAGYLGNVMPLIRRRRSESYDLYHAHYSLSAFVAALAGCKPLVVSLMGSDTRAGMFRRQIIRAMNSLLWDRVIVKSESMKEGTGLTNALVIPNGVDLDKVKPAEMGSNGGERIILFAADPSRESKNYALASTAGALLEEEGVTLRVLHSVSHDEVLATLAKADVVLLTSLWEGSPNVVKEAMACNVSVVSTDVGDVRWLFGDTPGYYITTFDACDVAGKLRRALSHGIPTSGRDRIRELGLDSGTIATRIKEVYDSTITPSGHKLACGSVQ
ncbi:MAG: glycosyltransferase [Bacteroidales bacterium]|nr:glycosyltransferase [Bacteroidales bacterium]